METKTTEKIEIKIIKHVFTDAEAHEIGRSLGRVLAEKGNIESEFDGVKADYKAKLAAKDTAIGQMGTELSNGFRMQNERCIVRYRAADRKKDYYLEAGFDEEIDAPVLTEDMNSDDFQAELLLAESKFDCREEIALFTPTSTDFGILVVGRLAGRWFAALRVTIGKLTLNERLDSEQKSTKLRSDMIRLTVKRAKDWYKENLKDLAKGFDAPADAVIEAHKERAE